MVEGGGDKMAFQALRNLIGSERGDNWNVRHLDPRASVDELANRLADYFSAISQEYPALNQNLIPRTYDRVVQDVSVDSVAARLTNMKTPKSCVTIDLPGKIMTRAAEYLSIALTPIINNLRQGTCAWPRIWSEEEVVAIPKTKNPENMDECRAISCTSLLSKLAETYMLSLIHI